MKKQILLIFLLSIILMSQAQVWNKLGNGLESWNGPTVFCLKEIDSLLYIGGGFFAYGESIMKGIAIWNGNTIDTLPTLKGTRTGSPRSIVKFDGKIILGGTFNNIARTFYLNDTSAIPNTNAIASWDGVQWASVGNGIASGAVYILQHKNDLFVGGGFNSAGGLSGLNCMARWDGSGWNSVGTGVFGDFSQVRAMAIFNNDLILGGYFIKAGGKPAYNIAGWDGTQYFDLDTGVLGDVYAMQVDSINNFIYVGGEIYHVGGDNGFFVNGNILKWDGYTWDTVGINSVINNNGILSLTMYFNELYAGLFDINDTYMGIQFCY